MSLFVDASALVALMANEPEAASFAERMRDANGLLWSAMSCWETISALRRSYGFTIEAARLDLAKLAEVAAFTLVDVGSRELEMALDAYQQYGKGRHPAALNMGDCFAYACAKANDAVLLYKGNNFALTDLA